MSERLAYTLPDGRTFPAWDCETRFTKTYHVDPRHPQSRDDGPGSEDQPFRTISRAAEEVGPGERVVIAHGTYREFVRPRRGGHDAASMISYEAAPGADVVLTGAEPWAAEWVPSTGWRLGKERHRPDQEHTVIWQGDLPPEAFHGINPFGMVNIASIPFGVRDTNDFRRIKEPAPDRAYLMRRGLVFAGGAALQQVVNYWELGCKPGTYWVEDNGLVVHFRLPDDGDPHHVSMEFTAREQVFSPAVPGLGFIRVKGLRFEKVGNGFPAPQRGALSTFCGHHWIIEDNRVAWANSIGIDIGMQATARHLDSPRGRHIVRRNHVTDCGIGGICGTHCDRVPMLNLRIEDNRLERCCWHEAEHDFESAALKFHNTLDCLVTGNIIGETTFGSGIWLDARICNTRVAGNVVLDTKHTVFGGIFIEVSHEPNLVDQNVVIGVGDSPYGNPGKPGGSGIYEHDCDSLTIRDNVVVDVAGPAIHLHLGEPGRVMYGKGSTGMDHKVLRNLLENFGYGVVLPNTRNRLDGNFYGKDRRGRLIWVRSTPEQFLNRTFANRFYGWEAGGAAVDAEVTLDKTPLRLNVRVTLDGRERRDEIELRQPHALSQFFDRLQAWADAKPDVAGKEEARNAEPVAP